MTTALPHTTVTTRPGLGSTGHTGPGSNSCAAARYPTTSCRARQRRPAGGDRPALRDRRWRAQSLLLGAATHLRARHDGAGVDGQLIALTVHTRTLHSSTRPEVNSLSVTASATEGGRVDPATPTPYAAHEVFSCPDQLEQIALLRG